MRAFGVTDFTRVSYGAHGNVRLHTYHIPRAQPAHLWCEASDRRHPSSGARGVEDAAPYGGCETYAAACKVTCAVLPRRTKGARAVPAGLDALGGGREAGAPWITWMLSDTPDGCNQPGPAIPRSRGVEDAAPYGRLRNERLSMERNGH